MKKYKNKIIICFALLLLCVIPLIFSGKAQAFADSSAAYGFDVSAYHATYDVGRDCKVKVAERLTINYKGYDSTGFYRDIPINNEARIENVAVQEIVSGESVSVTYNVLRDHVNYLTLDIGDTTHKRGNYTYLITYDYILYPLNDALSLNVVGTGWDCTVSDIDITITVPQGFLQEKSNCVTGELGSTTQLTPQYEGNTIRIVKASLPNNNGITMHMQFAAGALTGSIDPSPWLLLLIPVGLLIALILIKFLVFPTRPLMPVVNFTAPDDMDPLMMGHLIDGKVSNEDITSLLFYWANKGYISINLDNEDDPILTRKQYLPNGTPQYQEVLFSAIFAGGDTVLTSSLQYKIYGAVEKTGKMVSRSNRNMYTKASVTAGMAFTVIAGLIMALIPIILPMTRVSTLFFDPVYLLAVLGVIPIYALTQSVFYKKNKLSKKKFVLLLTGVAALGVALSLVYIFLVPATVLELAPRIILCVLTLAIVMLSVTLMTRTKTYSEQLNQIMGFKNFITLVEKDKLEALLQENPQLYYHVLPYAQVLGVSDIWDDKFKALTYMPPYWLSGGNMRVTNYVVMSVYMRRSMARTKAVWAARPSNSASSGGGRFFGGGFSGGVGGGFGGGGGRGR